MGSRALPEDRAGASKLHENVRLPSLSQASETLSTGPFSAFASGPIIRLPTIDGGAVPRPSVFYLGGSAVLVGTLYLLYVPSKADPRALALEALFAWLVVFVPPLLLVERSLALARLLLRRARRH